MARDISFIQYMRAHGNTPGPTQRPLLTGAISGLISAIPYVGVLYISGAIRSITEGLQVNFWVGLTAACVLSLLGGMLYAFVFKRAANDRRGGWLFGMSFGFLLWMLGPVTLWQSVTARPMATGTSAMGIFGAQVLYGLVVGAVFPLIHLIFRAQLSDISMDDKTSVPHGEKAG